MHAHMAGPTHTPHCTVLHLPAAQRQLLSCLIWGPTHLPDTPTANAALASGKGKTGGAKIVQTLNLAAW